MKLGGLYLRSASTTMNMTLSNGADACLPPSLLSPKEALPGINGL